MAGTEEILERIRSGLLNKNPFLVAIDGPCGSGKSTLARSLQKEIPAVILPMDDFFLPKEMRTKERLSLPGENVDHERFLKEVLLPLSQGKDFSYSPYDCHKDAMGERKSFSPHGLFLIEGSYSFHPDLLPFYDLKVFVTVSKEEQRRRLQERERERFPMFEQRWIPLEEKYFQKCDPRSQADLIVTE